MIHERKFRLRFHIVSLAIATAILGTGCASQVSSNKSTSVPKSAANPVDGTIASMQVMNVPGQNPGIKIYKMFYWSSGEKIEGYVTEPKNTGAYQYPLVVNCHGGYAQSMSNMQHATSPTTPDEVAQSNSNVVTFYPEYRGYADSDGSVSDIKDNVIDTENGINAVQSLPMVRTDTMGLDGASMGGDVVLMIASSPKYFPIINYVIAVSPFVGWDTVEKWAVQNEKTNNVAERWVIQGNNSFGRYYTHKQSYTENSPDIANIDSPVLLLQGTGDPNVPWKSVQLFYQEMKQAGKNVTLDLIPGGNHGLTGKYEVQRNQDIKTWWKSIS